MIKDALLEQLVQTIAETVWKRPELESLREPIEQTFQATRFRDLTRRAFIDLDTDALPDFFDEGFIQMPRVQDTLARFIVHGEAVDIDTLADLYADRFLTPAQAPDVRPQLASYLGQLRETLATDDTYGPLLLARDMQVAIASLQNLQSDMSDVKQLLRDLLAEPEIQALIERKQGRHIFLSYTRANLGLAARIRRALEDAGHTVWQDVTAIKGGIEWIQSIEDGIDRSYAVVSVVSRQSQESEWVTIEYLHAARREKPIVPIKVDDCDIPTMMLARNVVHGHPNIETGIATLIAALPPVDAPETQTAPPDDSDIPSEATRRQREIDYLDRILLEHSVWQTVYTPMSGVGQMRIESADDEEWEVADVGMAQVFGSYWDETATEQPEKVETRQENYDNILDAVSGMRQFVLLGEPGSGKSTSLWRIAADYAQKAKVDESVPLPVIVRLGELRATESLRDKILATLGKLASEYDALLDTGRFFFLLDGLNEMPAENRATHAEQVKTLVETCQENGLGMIVSCRELDYTGVLDMQLPERVEVEPLDPLRIKQFVNAYITKPAGKGDELFWELAGETAQAFWQDFTEREVVEQGAEQVFWLQNTLPGGTKWEEYSFSTSTWDKWLTERDHPRSMLTLACNPFMLFMMTQVFTREKQLPPNRGTLFARFVDFLLEKREQYTANDVSLLKDALADLGYKMQREGEGTAFSPAQVSQHLTEKQLYMAKSANLLTGTDQIRFTHQLLQEYHAAMRLDREMLSGTPASTFFPSDKWWEPTGWEETAILLLGLYSTDTSPVIQWLQDAQPELTARCILESGAHTPEETQQALASRWLTRIDDVSEPVLARAATGRALGMLNLDKREGVSVTAEGTPDILWCKIPAGEFLYGKDKETHTIEQSYGISKYLITNAQFAPFIRAEGYTQRRYWTEAGWERKEQGNWAAPRYWQDSKWNLPNHPVVSVSWYEVHAYTQWLSEQLGYAVSLPTDHQWERAARGTDGREYPWGDEWEVGKCNNRAGDKSISQTSIVGMFPDGISPSEVHDMAGNVWKWCLTAYESGSNEPDGEDTRVLRGGAWSYDPANDFRCAIRFRGYPYDRDHGRGFRVARSYT